MTWLAWTKDSNRPWCKAGAARAGSRPWRRRSGSEIGHDQPETLPSPTPSSLAARGVVAPKTGDFGKVQVGASSAPLRITVANLGPGTMRIAETALLGPDREAFVVEQTTCFMAQLLQPRGDCEVTVRFRPKSTGPFHATLVIQHSGTDAPKRSAAVGNRGAALIPM